MKGLGRTDASATQRSVAQLLRRSGVPWLVLLLCAGCTGASVALTEPPSSQTPSAGGSPLAASPSPTSAPLPSGLAARPGLPALVNGQAAACLPLCAQGLARPGALPIGTRYQTEWFFGGYMTLAFDAAWTAIEDSTGELKIAPAEDAEYGAGIALDLYPVDAGVRVTNVEASAEGMLEWLRSNPNLIVSAPSDLAIGAVPATFVRIRLAPDATSEHPDCPATCVDFLGFEQWDHANGILGDDVYGFAVADVEYSGTRHVLSLTIEGRDEDHLETMLARLDPILLTVTVPARSTEAR